MTNQNNTEGTVTISHRDAKLNDLREDRIAAFAKVQKIDEKIAALELEAVNEQAIADLKPGSGVSFVFGRAVSRRILTGTVRFVGTNDKGVTQLKVETGEGLDAEFLLIDAAALLMTSEQIIATQASIEAAVAEAAEAARAAAEKAGANTEGAK